MFSLCVFICDVRAVIIRLAFNKANRFSRKGVVVCDGCGSVGLSTLASVPFLCGRDGALCCKEVGAVNARVSDGAF
jgi:hypothetical protein